MSASADLLWELVRPWNCHQIKRTHPLRKSTVEKGSLAGGVTSVDSGLANRKAIAIEVDEDGLTIGLKNDDEAEFRKPDKMWTNTSNLSGGARKAIAKADYKLSSYRPAAKALALRKVSALARAEARRKAGYDHTKVKKGRY